MIGIRYALVACTLLAVTVPASAQDDTALALTLFEDGKRLVDAQDYPKACPKFSASYKLVPKLGTLLNLADCYEKSGKTASAWARFSEAITIAERANQPERAAFAKQHADDLAPQLSTLTLVAPKATPGLVVTRDGTAMPAATLGLPVPIDPGDHTIEASAPKKNPWSTNVAVGKSEAKRFEIPGLEDAPEPPPLPTAAPPCEEGDASCGRPFENRKRFIQARAGGGFSVGGFLGKPPAAPFGSGATNYEGAHYSVGGGAEGGLSVLFGLQKFPAGVPGFFSGVLVEPLLGFFGAATIGTRPISQDTGASGDFFLRLGTTLGYQLLWFPARNPITNHQRGFGFMVGYRPGVQYAFVRGAFFENNIEFTHGPVVALVFPDYFPRAVELVRSFLEVAFLHAPVTSAFFVTIGGGASFN